MVKIDVDSVLRHAPDLFKHSHHTVKHGREIFKKDKTGDQRVEHGLEIAGAFVGLGLLALRFYREHHARRAQEETPKQ